MVSLGTLFADPVGRVHEVPTRGRHRFAGALWLVAACGPQVVSTGGDSTGSTGATTAVGSTGVSTSSSTGSSPSGSADEGSDGPVEGFVSNPDLGVGDECEFYVQDCPPGRKCNLYGSMSNSYDASACFPVVDDPGRPGEPCETIDGRFSGLDTCEVGSICWNEDFEATDGVCRAYCVGDYGTFVCEDPDTICRWGDAGVPICAPDCDPLEDDCREGELCVQINFHFICIPDASGDMGAVGDPCEYLNVCDPGNYCVAPDAVPDCMAPIGCCSAFCDLGDADPPCLPGQTCLPWFSENIPVGFEHLGICALPP